MFNIEVGFIIYFLFLVIIKGRDAGTGKFSLSMEEMLELEDSRIQNPFSQQHNISMPTGNKEKHK